MMREAKVCSAAYSRELAASIEDSLGEPGDGTIMGPTDAEACVAALRYHAGRHGRRLVLAIGGLMVAGLGAAPWLLKV